MEDQTTTPVSKARFVTGAVLLVGGFLSPLLAPLVVSSGLPATWKTLLTTGLVVGIPEVGMVAAVAVLGKQGFNELKSRIFSVLKKHTQPATISTTRYRIGLLMFFIPLLTGWMVPYLSYFFPRLLSEWGRPSLVPMIVLDLVFAASFLVLGAGFWDKIQSLFVHEPNDQAANSP